MIIRILIIALIVAAIIAARKSRPAASKEGQTLIGLPDLAEEPSSLTVATFNIQTGKDLYGRRDLMASANVLAQADLVGVQEVYASTFANDLGLGVSQTQALAQRGGFGWLFCATRRRWLREHRGNAVLSRLPVREWAIEMLPDQSNKSFRNMTTAHIEWRGETFQFINTHLHTREGREAQLEVVLREFARYPRAILVGDFNSRANTPALATALKDIEITDAISVAGLDLENPDRIDWILTKGFKVETGLMLEKGVSDHPYYQVTLSYN